MIRLLACAVPIAIVLASCGGSTQETRAHAAYAAYVDAVRSGHAKDACTMITPELRLLTEQLGGCESVLDSQASKVPSAAQVAATRVHVTGAKATYVMGTGGTGNMRRAGSGRWLIDVGDTR